MTPFRRRLFGASSAALAAVLVYLNALHNLFVYDDHRLIVENVSIQHAFDIKAIVLHEVTRPLVNVSYALDHALWGPSPFGYHLTNLLLHALNVILFFGLACSIVADWQRRRTPAAVPIRPETAATAAAVLFAVHPLMTEAVGYASGRSELLCAAFFLLAFASARRWLIGGGRSWWWLTFLAWVPALASKEIAIVLPVAVALYDRLVLRPGAAGGGQSRLPLHVPLAAIALLAAAARLLILTRLEYPARLEVHWPYVLLELDVARRYLTMLFVP